MTKIYEVTGYDSMESMGNESYVAKRFFDKDKAYAYADELNAGYRKAFERDAWDGVNRAAKDPWLWHLSTVREVEVE